MRSPEDWEEVEDLSKRYVELQERKESAYLDFAERLQEQVDADELTERAAKAVLQVAIVADDEEDWDLARTIYSRGLMFPDWEPETLLLEDEEVDR